LKLLLVEDDHDLSQGLLKALKHEGFVLSHAASVKQAQGLLVSFEPDLVVLDLGLPDRDGIELLKGIRSKKDVTPVLVLTARSGLDDKVQALDFGADDYLAKPFEMAELLARLRAMSRRLGTAVSSEIVVGPVKLDTVAHRLSVNDQAVELTKKEYMVLKLLLESAGRIKTKDMLENNLYSWGEEIGSNAIEVHISNLRKKLPDGFIKTIRGVGYTIGPARS